MKRGTIELNIQETSLIGLAGEYRFGETKVSIFTDKIPTVQRAAGYVAHETKHYLQNIDSSTYKKIYEYEAYMWQSIVDPTWRIDTPKKIWDFINSNNIYKHLK